MKNIKYNTVDLLIWLSVGFFIVVATYSYFKINYQPKNKVVLPTSPPGALPKPLSGV